MRSCFVLSMSEEDSPDPEPRRFSGISRFVRNANWRSQEGLWGNWGGPVAGEKGGGRLGAET